MPDPTLHQYLEADLSNGALGAPEWQETIQWYPKGVQADAQGVIAVVDRRREEGTNEVDGDGATPDSSEGRRIRSTYLIDVSNSLATDKKDTWLIDGQLYSTIRRVGRDSSAGGTQTLRVVAIDGDFTRQSRLRPTANWRERSRDG